VATLEKDGIERGRIRLAREADVRYAGQSMEVRVPAPAGEVDAAFIAGTIDAFHAAHLKAFGYNYAGRQKIEIVNFCVSGFGMIDRPAIPKLGTATAAKPQWRNRPVYFSGGFRDTPIYDRSALPAGFRLDGPAVVEEFGSTTVIFPGQCLTVDERGILIVQHVADGAGQ
jgi:N-methylhydantoinase A